MLRNDLGQWSSAMAPAGVVAKSMLPCLKSEGMRYDDNMEETQRCAMTGIKSKRGGRSATPVLVALWALLTAFAPSADLRAAETSGLPLPRFASLRSDEVNLRIGPGTRYPVDWIYSKRDLPVEVIAEFDAWRKIRDWQGTEGWVHKTMLSGQRMVVVIGDTRKLRSSDSEDAGAVAMIESGVSGRLLQCPRNNAFCRVDIQHYSGWLRRDEFWGVYKGEWTE